MEVVVSNTREFEYFIMIADQPVKVITHPIPHHDELGASIVAEMYGDDAFIARYVKDGRLVLGIGHGELDEHAGDGQEAKKDTTLGLTIKANGLERVLASYMKYGKRADKGHDISHFGLHTVIRNMFEGGISNTDVLNWLRLGLSAALEQITDPLQYDLQNVGALVITKFGKTKGYAWLKLAMDAQVTAFTHHNQESKPEYVEKAVISSIPGPQGELNLVVIESNNNRLANYALAPNGGGADIVVVQNSTGNTVIQFSRRMKPRKIHADLTGLLKLSEQRARENMHCTDWDKLRAEGTINKAWDVWHSGYGCMILNGSKSAPDVDPTKLSLDEITELIKVAADPKQFHPDFAETCQLGLCEGSRSPHCPWHGAGLSRCRTIRHMNR